MVLFRVFERGRVTLGDDKNVTFCIASLRDIRKNYNIIHIVLYLVVNWVK